MNIIPFPKKIKEESNKVKYRTIKNKPTTDDKRIDKALDKLPYSESGAELLLNISEIGGEGYKLRLCESKVIIDADSPAGAFYAIQTLKQIFENETVYCAEIEDEPDFKYRGFYHDITRGKVPTLGTLKRLIDKMAYCKLNSLQLYVEHTFEFREFADSVERTGYITADELKELDAYCTENFIEFVPSLSTFGHLFELLEKEKYKHLREAEADPVIAWPNRMSHHTIDPTKDESFELIKSLIDQYMPCFTSDKFNICCDETFDLTNGRHKGEDTGKLYVDFVCKLINYIRSKGKKVMMWADILLQHPQVIDKIPEDTILLNWDYSENADEEKVELLAKTGKMQIVCPGTWTWSRLCENVHKAEQNINLMAKYGHKYDTEGVLNTNWGDWGNPCSLELAMHGFALGAEKSWNTDADDNYDERINEIIYKNERGSEYLRRLSDIQNIASWQKIVRMYSNFSVKSEMPVGNTPKESLERAEKECDTLIKDVLSDSWKQENYKEELLSAAEGMKVIIHFIAAYEGYKISENANPKKWIEEYSRLWLEKNKPSELHVVQDMIAVLSENLK